MALLDWLRLTDSMSQRTARLLTTRNLDIAVHLIMSGLSRVLKPVPEQKLP